MSKTAQTMNRSVPEPTSAPATTEVVVVKFHFGSGRQYSMSAKQKKCIIQRSQTLPTLLGLRAQSLTRRLAV
jgi:hypothetical protein